MFKALLKQGLDSDQIFTCDAVRARPSFQAGLVAILVTGVMSKKLVTWPAELVAAETVVVFLTGYPDLILELGHRAIV